MKKKDKAEIDPIKAKYTQERGFFKKISIKYNNFKESIKNNKDLMEDTSAFFSIVINVGLYGVLGAAAATLAGIGFSFMSVLSIGALLWLTEHKFVEMITRVFGSIKLVSINQ